jgi:flagellar biosynthesis protein FlhA
MPCPANRWPIDAELSAGIINENEARTRRRKPSRTGSRLLRGDGRGEQVRARRRHRRRILITLINILGGFAIGIAQKGMTRHRVVATLHAAVHRGRTGVADPGAHHLHRRRHPGHARRVQERLGQELGKTAPLRIRGRWRYWRAMMAVFALVPGLPVLPFLVLAEWPERRRTRSTNTASRTSRSHSRHRSQAGGTGSQRR